MPDSKSTLFHSNESINPSTLTKEQVKGIIGTFAFSPSPHEYRWITRGGKGSTPTTYVLESLTDPLLISRIYAPNVSVRVPLVDLNNPNLAKGICKALVKREWDHKMLKGVLVRMRHHTVPISALVKNEARHHRYQPFEIVDALSRVLTTAQWYLDRKPRKDAFQSLSKAVIPKTPIDSLDILCRGEIVWVTSPGALFVGYEMNRVDGSVWKASVDSKTHQVVTECLDTIPSTLVNGLKIGLYEKHLTDLPKKERLPREDALTALTQRYEIDPGNVRIKA